MVFCTDNIDKKGQNMAIMNAIVENPDGVRQADIVFGLPSYNEADNIAVPTDTASRGLMEFFPNVKSVIINVDNDSPDGTRDAFLNTPTKVPKVYISTPPGVKGKGNNLKNLFKAAAELDAKAIVVADSDLESMTTRWVRYLIDPLFHGVDFVSPIYVRHKYDGTITNHVAYPMMRTLFGLRTRQPIGGDFGFSGTLARAFLSEKFWNEKVAHYGIDIWMSTIAIARHYNVCQAFLGTPKVHREKDPSKDLTRMFTQVVSTLFDLMIEYEHLWKYIRRSSPTQIYGFGLGASQRVREIQVDTRQLLANFVQGFDDYGEVWEEILPLPVMKEVEKLRSPEQDEALYYHSDLWARILFSFAVAYRENEGDGRIMQALIPFYQSRVLSFVNKTREMDTQEAEEYLEDINRVFESEKYYLIQRWDESDTSRAQRLFA
jgi:glycosyltransferase involved in cell wall biosynthesis